MNSKPAAPPVVGKGDGMEEIIMRESPLAASLKSVDGWVSRNGFYFGTDEGAARYDGCTHVKCMKCGLPTPKSHLYCSKCSSDMSREKYLEMPRLEWDGEAMIYSHTRDKYYCDIEQICDELQDESGTDTLDSLQLVICEPTFGSEICADHFADELPEDGEVPDQLLDAIDEFNKAVRVAGPLSWHPGKYALCIPRSVNGEGRKV